MDLSTLPVSTAKLPLTYERARDALAQCHRIDECQDWADKMAALASYARQADDEVLFKTAMKIKGRAVIRVGQLLKEIEPAKGGEHFHKSTKGGAPLSATAPMLTRKAAAEAAGLSADQAKQALRVASIPEDELEAALEAEVPPTITQLAEMGTKHRELPPDYLRGFPPAEFNAAIHTRARVRDLAVQCVRSTARAVVGTAHVSELAELREWVPTIQAWLSELEGELK